MTEITLAAVIGLLVGIGATLGFTLKAPPAAPDKTSETQPEVIKQLTSLDIVEPLCTPEKMTDAKSLLLCRELTCLAFTRGIDSQTGGAQCEEISNITNKIIQMEHCTKQESPEKIEDCFDLFWRRQ